MTELIRQYWLNVFNEWAESRLSPPQYDEAHQVLVEAGLVEVAGQIDNGAKWKGDRMKIRDMLDEIVEILNHADEISNEAAVRDLILAVSHIAALIEALMRYHHIDLNANISDGIILEDAKIEAGNAK
jgi:uncharacterized UPF0160 family protein